MSAHSSEGPHPGRGGRVGCGKSTLIRTIMGILREAPRVDRGEIWFEGETTC